MIIAKKFSKNFLLLFTLFLSKTYIISQIINNKDSNMTLEEEKELRQKISDTILPLAMNMTEDQIRNIISSVEKGNSDLQKGFGAMLFEQIMVQKNNRLRRNIS